MAAASEQGKTQELLSYAESLVAELRTSEEATRCREERESAVEAEQEAKDQKTATIADALRVGLDELNRRRKELEDAPSTS